MSLRASRRVVLSLAAGAFAATVASLPAFAADDPKALIQQAADQVIEIIKSTKGAEREAAIQKVMLSSFDMNYMGRAALGTHWEGTSEADRQRYLKAAVAAEAHAYSDRFGQYGGQTLTLGKVINRPNNVSIVESKLNQTDGPPINIQWEVRDTGQGARITDVKIEGVSMVMTRRSDFNSYIQGHGGKVGPLIEELEKRAGK